MPFLISAVSPDNRPGFLKVDYKAIHTEDQITITRRKAKASAWDARSEADDACRKCVQFGPDGFTYSVTEI